MAADIAFGKSAEQGIDEGMDRDVGVAVAGEAMTVRNEQAAEPEFFARFETMHVETEARAADQLLRQQALHPFMIAGQGDFLKGRVAFDEADVLADGADHLGVVGGLLGAVPCAMGVEQDIEIKGLRRLHPAQAARSTTSPEVSPCDVTRVSTTAGRA